MKPRSFPSPRRPSPTTEATHLRASRVERWKAGTTTYVKVPKTKAHAALLKHHLKKHPVMAEYFVNGVCVALQFAERPLMPASLQTRQTSAPAFAKSPPAHQ